MLFDQQNREQDTTFIFYNQGKLLAITLLAYPFPISSSHQLQLGLLYSYLNLVVVIDSFIQYKSIEHVLLCIRMHIGLKEWNKLNSAIKKSKV